MIDLHSHTTCSDGTDSPSELIRKGKEAGLSAIAITDHDTVSGVQEALDMGKSLGITVISGVEFSAVHEPGNCHILGYFVNHQDPAFLGILSAVNEKRNGRNILIADALKEAGYDITIEEVIAAPVVRWWASRILPLSWWRRDISMTFLQPSGESFMLGSPEPYRCRG